MTLRELLVWLRQNCSYLHLGFDTDLPIPWLPEELRDDKGMIDLDYVIREGDMIVLDPQRKIEGSVRSEWLLEEKIK